jgi:hypothetical protein
MRLDRRGVPADQLRREQFVDPLPSQAPPESPAYPIPLAPLSSTTRTITYSRLATRGVENVAGTRSGTTTAVASIDSIRIVSADLRAWSTSTQSQLR